MLQLGVKFNIDFIVNNYWEIRMYKLTYEVRDGKLILPSSLTITGYSNKERVLEEAKRLAKELRHADSHPRNFKVRMPNGEVVQI